MDFALDMDILDSSSTFEGDNDFELEEDPHDLLELYIVMDNTCTLLIKTFVVNQRILQRIPSLISLFFSCDNLQGWTNKPSLVC